ncbi:putative iron-sulfur cluster-binding metallochaperone [Gordoniibacillus kamchatkensis]|uniref:putative iron-sulfur cluster-binding metallochaperone n=1 Tax=Gordoniibacillus kamchatkensis TaxID=1590651 RepID=UPI0009E3E9AA|nr:copper chaperone Copz family protein [Paenibacillus sp. VKM B-2647]
MENCCVTNHNNISESFVCPSCNNSGKQVGIITLKSLLTPTALEQLNPNNNYRFCSTSTCEVVYFDQVGQFFNTAQIKVSVFQKDSNENTSVCYCFNWTRQRLTESGKTAIDSISSHVKAGRCGCEVNNPQGSCCLGNVTQFVRSK